MQLNNWEAKRQAREKLELEAEARLKARGHRDPRGRPIAEWLEPGMYDEMKRYDTLLAKEVIALMRKGSNPEKPDNSYDKQPFKQDYVRQPYKD